MDSSINKKYYCEKCNFKCNNTSQWKIHTNTNKHNFVKKILENEIIDISINSDITKNISKEQLPKNFRNIPKEIVIKTIVNENNEDESQKHKCSCGKSYKYKQGLYVHKKKCSGISKSHVIHCTKEDKPEIELFMEEIVRINPTDIDKGNFLFNTLKELVTQNQELVTQNQELVTQNQEFKNTLINENKEFRTMVMEHTSKIIETNKSSNITNNIQNNKFNLNIFLNEECKDAINITDYVNRMELQLEDLEVTAQLGYTDGITKIISDRIRGTRITERPFHCTDGKREIVYVKDNDIWEKEHSDKPRMRKLITNVIHKNLQQLIKWHEKYPECSDSLNNKSDEYLNIMIEANGGQEREKKEEQILKNILKEALLK